MLSSKDYDAIGVALSCKTLAKHLKSRPLLFLGSDSRKAWELLKTLSGGDLHEYEFLYSQNFNRATMHQAVDPIQLHMDHRVLLDKLLLLTIREPAPVGTVFERHVTLTCAEVKCTSLLVVRPKFKFYQVLCNSSATDAYTELIKKCKRHLGGRDIDLAVGFIRVHYDMDGKDILLNVSPEVSKDSLDKLFR